jgi:hypothetical protein
MTHLDYIHRSKTLVSLVKAGGNQTHMDFLPENWDEREGARNLVAVRMHSRSPCSSVVHSFAPAPWPHSAKHPPSRRPVATRHGRALQHVNWRRQAEHPISTTSRMLHERWYH